MPKYSTTRHVKHSADHMFDLVADVEEYPEFLPLCQSLIIRRRKPLDDRRELVVADMRVGFKAIREHFTSRITLDRLALTIDVEYVEGPFESLQNRWTFVPDHAAPDTARSDVSFYIDYEFRSRMLGLLMGSMFDTAFRRFAEAFEQRADQVYGVTG